MRQFSKMAAAGAVAVALAAPLVAAAPAQASTLREVCAEDLYVRDAPLGKAIGTLYRGQHIEVDRYSEKGWAHGFAYGHVNKYGWVDAQWLC